MAGQLDDAVARTSIVAGVLPWSRLAVFGVSLRSGKSAPAPAKVIEDKGTPFGDLLVPKLTASVKDGAVGVTVDAPVTVSAADGVLGSVDDGQRERPAGRRSAQP